MTRELRVHVLVKTDFGGVRVYACGRRTRTVLPHVARQQFPQRGWGVTCADCRRVYDRTGVA